MILKVTSNSWSILAGLFQFCRIQARHRPQVRTSWALTTNPFPSGAAAARQSVSATTILNFHFFLAAVATPIIGMDFLAKFELSIIPAKQQVLHAAFSKSKEQHWTHLRTLFAILAANGLALNLEKCVFALSGMDFLGHRISAAGVAPLRNNFQVILDSPYPTDCKAMQRFLGMINFYRRFLPGVAGTLRPLTAALSGHPKTLPWTPDMETAFAAAWRTPFPKRSSPWRPTPPTPMSERSCNNR
jgi:hypothetical protein